MAIKVKFGKNLSDNRYITKNIEWKTEDGFNCDVYDATDRLNPVIVVDTTQVDLSDTNYMEIPEFGRKYFITSIVGTAAKTVNVSGHVDVLGTYDEQIRKCKCIIERSSTPFNFYLQDNRRLCNSYVINDYYVLGDLGDPTDVILVTLGSGEPT